MFVEYGDADALRAAVDDDTAAVVLEPVQGEAGAVVPPTGYLTAAREATSRHLEDTVPGVVGTGKDELRENVGATQVGDIQTDR